MRPAVRVSLDETECHCITYCEGICPEVFRVNAKRNVAEVIQPVVTDAALFATLEEVERTCPTQAISLQKTTVET